MTTTFKKCKLFDKTFAKTTKQIQTKFKDFINWKKDHPTEKFGSSDYPFTNSGNFGGFWHAKLSFDVSVIYKQEKGVILLFGVFSHDESGTGQPANLNKQASLRSKLDHQEFA